MPGARDEAAEPAEAKWILRRPATLSAFPGRSVDDFVFPAYGNISSSSQFTATHVSSLMPMVFEWRMLNMGIKVIGSLAQVRTSPRPPA